VVQVRNQRTGPVQHVTSHAAALLDPGNEVAVDQGLQVRKMLQHPGENRGGKEILHQKKLPLLDESPAEGLVVKGREGPPHLGVQVGQGGGRGHRHGSLPGVRSDGVVGGEGDVG
jgi:hypothetical protein